MNHLCLHIVCSSLLFHNIEMNNPKISIEVEYDIYSQGDKFCSPCHMTFYIDQSDDALYRIMYWGIIEFILPVQKDQSKRLPIELCVWDLAGDECYKATHHCFFTPNSLYLVVWDLWSLAKDMEKIGKLLYSIEVSLFPCCSWFCS